MKLKDLDHKTMSPPHLRVVQETPTAGGDVVYLWDFRIAQPNVAVVPGPTMHSMEHFLGDYFRRVEWGDDAKQVIHVAPMGCGTGLYIMALNISDVDEMAALVEAALGHVTTATVVPLANETQCGAAEAHSLHGARALAAFLRRRRADWADLGPYAQEQKG